MITRRNTDGTTSDERPQFSFHRPPGGSYSFEHITAELAEDSRNLLEKIRDSQMMQCDVANAIKSMSREMRLCRLALQKIAKRKRCSQCRKSRP